MATALEENFVESAFKNFESRRLGSELDISEEHCESQSDNDTSDDETHKIDQHTGNLNDSTGSGEQEEDKSGQAHQMPLHKYMVVFNKLQSVCRALGKDGIDLGIPQIVVVGGQSAGKTSLLENIAQEVFLPSGKGTVTKCPLILHFINSDLKFYLIEGERFEDPKLVKDLIKEMSETRAKHNGGISNEPITIEIHSPFVPTMTLLDLPGLIQIERMDQDPTLPDRIEKLVLHHIRHEKTIILAVASADADFQTSKAIKLAQEVDPEGRRTLAVLTRLDRVDMSCTDDKNELRNTLEGRTVQVKLGIIGVVNRIKKQTFLESKLKEENLLRKHFPALLRQNGITYLGDTLGKLQMHHLQDSIPTLMRGMGKGIKQQEAIIDDLGCGKISDKRDILRRILTRFASEYKAEVEGTNRHINTETLCGGVNIRCILDLELCDQLNNLNSLSEVTNARIVNAISNSPDINGINYLTEAAFKMLVTQQVMEMEPACLASLDGVYDVMRDPMLKNCIPFKQNSKFGRYPPLEQELELEFRKSLEEPYNEVTSKIKDYISTQAYTPKTYNSEFENEWMGEDRKSLGLMSQDEVLYLQDLLSRGEEIEPNPDFEIVHTKLEFLKGGIKKYVGIVKAQVQDQIPKIVKRHMIFEVCDTIQDLMMDFYTRTVSARKEGSLIREGDDIIQKRENAKKKKKMFEDALDGFREADNLIKFGVQNAEGL